MTGSDLVGEAREVLEKRYKKQFVTDITHHMESVAMAEHKLDKVMKKFQDLKDMSFSEYVENNPLRNSADY